MSFKPFIKWAGGKRSLAEQISSLIGPIDADATYFEPFLGGGAVLLHCCPQNAICTDINEELINLYNVIKDNPSELLQILKDVHFKKHSSSYYYRVRNLDRDIKKFSQLSAIQRAARFLYLNKTCYNGLWRENSNGQNNVPIGRYKNPCVVSESEILSVSQYFNSANIQFLNQDYHSVLDRVKEGDIVYFDPPYDIEETQNGFVAYAKGGFNREDQVSLKNLCDALVQIGASVAVSNSNTEFIRSLYSGAPVRYELHDEIIARRSIGSHSTSRKKISELLIIGRP